MQRFLQEIMRKKIILGTRTTDTQWRHKSKISKSLGRCGRQNMLWPYLKIWDWDWIFGRAVKAISSLGVRSPWLGTSEAWSMSRLSHRPRDPAYHIEDCQILVRVSRPHLSRSKSAKAMLMVRLEFRRSLGHEYFCGHSLMLDRNCG